MPKIIPHLWFDNQAEQAVGFYTSIFPNSRIGRITRYGAAGAKVSGRTEGSVMTIGFRIQGLDFIALNGGPIFKFNESISFMVKCETQKEIDYYWTRLSKGGDKKAQICGWLKDKYGLSWQIAPSFLDRIQQDNDSSRVNRVMEALFKMKKINIGLLQKADRQK